MLPFLAKLSMQAAPVLGSLAVQEGAEVAALSGAGWASRSGRSARATSPSAGSCAPAGARPMLPQAGWRM